MSSESIFSLRNFRLAEEIADEKEDRDIVQAQTEGNDLDGFVVSDSEIVMVSDDPEEVEILSEKHKLRQRLFIIDTESEIERTACEPAGMTEIELEY